MEASIDSIFRDFRNVRLRKKKKKRHCILAKKNRIVLLLITNTLGTVFLRNQYSGLVKGNSIPLRGAYTTVVVLN